jgi:tRNA A-37 threonylcarbamoyl transferase component Bud32
MSQSAFTKDKQVAFKASLAQAAGVASEAVVINKIESISSRRHLLAEAIRVETSIMAAGEAAAQELAGRLTADSINRELSKAGLPTATVLEAATPALNSEASSSSFFSTPVLVGVILGIVFLTGLVACFCRWKCKNHIITPSHDTQRPATLEMGTLATSVNESPVYDALGVSSASRLEKVQGSGKLREPLAQDAGPGQVQTNQARDKEAEAVVPHIQYSELAVESNALAAGSFKSVYKARWEKEGRNVALLVLRHSNQEALSDMDNEIRMFGTLGKHKHLAQLLATCTQAQSEEKCMVMEFAPLGSLDHALSKADEDGVDVSNLVKITLGMQVAEAMTHLHLYNVVHRDLATRNTLVFRFDPQNWKLVLVKVTDYGLSLLAHKGFTEGASVIEVATMSSNAAGPTRWMAPESIMRRLYSKKSDVWSFGVVLYEVWTLGMIPYHLIADDKEVARRVTQGERLSQPGNCPQQVYAIMQDCWKSAQKDRPSMPELQTALQEVFTKESLEEAKSECVVCLTAEPGLCPVTPNVPHL